MSTRTARAAAIAAALLALASCSSGNDDSARRAPDPTPESALTSTQPTPTTTTAIPTTTAGPKKTPQGWLIKDIGEMAGLGGNQGDTLETSPIKFTVDRIEVNPRCQQYGTKAKPGNKTVVLYVTMTTGQVTEEEAFAAAMIFNPFSMKGVTPDGFIHDAQPGSCTGYERAFPNEIAPNGKYSGIVDLELPATATSVVSAEGSTGWSWPIGG